MVFVIDRTLFDNDRIFYAETVYFQAKAVYFKSGSQNLLGSYTVYRYLFPTFDNAKNDHLSASDVVRCSIMDHKEKI